MFNAELDKIKSIFGALGYPSDVIRNTINNTIAKLEKPIKQGPSNCPVCLRLTYLGKEAIALENNVKVIVNSTFRYVLLTISHFTRKLLNSIYKDTTTDQEKSNVIYKFKCNCNSVYVGRTSQRLHIRRDQHVTKSLKTWMETGLN